MAERFGSQDYPSGGQRFGSQEYAALAGTAAGDLHAVESGADVFEASSLPRVSGALAASEAGADSFAGTGLSSFTDTMQAHESPAPDTFVAAGYIIDASLRFGSQDHPSGGLRFGAQSWAALGPLGPMAATESGDDAVAAVGWLAGTNYGFSIFTVLASFVDYSSESLGAAITGTLEDGYKVLLPVTGPGVALTWEANAFGNPSLRLANLTGATVLSGVPWYVWDGSAWTAATFDVSDAMQGAVFMVETGADTFIGNGSQTRYGSMAMVESGADFVEIHGSVPARGSMAATEQAVADTFAADGAPSYIGLVEMVEADAPDVLAAAGAVTVTGDLASTEAATADTFAAVGSPSASGDLDATESGTDTFAAAGRLSSTGAMAAVEDDTADVLEGAGSIRVSGAAALVEPAGADTFEAAGDSARVGVLAAVEFDADTFAADGAVAVTGDLAATDRPDVFAATGQREAIGDVIAAELDATEGGADIFVARGIYGVIVPLITFDGPVDSASTTRVISVRSRRSAEAA